MTVPVIGFKWGSSKCALEDNHMHGVHWKKKWQSYPIHWQINQGLIHFIWLTCCSLMHAFIHPSHSSDLLTSKLISYWIHNCPHTLNVFFFSLTLMPKKCAVTRARPHSTPMVNNYSLLQYHYFIKIYYIVKVNDHEK